MPSSRSKHPTQMRTLHWVSVSAVVLTLGSCTLEDYNYLGARWGVVSGGTAGTSGTNVTGGTFPTEGGTGPELTGGTSSAGGTGGVASGGASTYRDSGTGNSTATGGTAEIDTWNTGGDSPTGGAHSATGGDTAGGASAGGATSASGGASASGGVTASGGNSATGGTTTTGGSSAGVGGAPTSCAGCAVLNVPFTTKGQSARFLMLFSPSATVNERGDTTGVSGGTSTITAAGKLKVRAYAPQLGNTQYQLFIQQSVSPYSQCSTGAVAIPSGITSNWVTLEFDLSGCSADTSIGRYAIDLLADSAVSAAVPSSTVIWIDSVWFEIKGNTVVGPYNFDTSGAVNPSAIWNDYDQSNGALYLRPNNPSPPTGSSISWMSNAQHQY